MPPPPEIVEGPRLKRGLEVLDQVIAQNARRAQGNVAAAGKVHVQLHGKQHRGGHEVRAAHAADIAVDQRDIVAQVVGKDHLFGVAPQHTERAARAAAIAEPAAFPDLRAHLGIALNGPVDEGGEEADKQRVVQQVCLDPAAALVDVDGVAHRRKREVAQPQRGQQILPMGEDAAAHRVGQQVPVFVVDKDADAEPHRRSQCQYPHGLGPDLADDEAAQPGQHRGGGDHPDQRAVDGVIAEEAVAGGQQKVGPQHTGQGIVDERHCRKKGEEQQRGNCHGLILAQEGEDLLPSYRHDSNSPQLFLFFQVAHALFQHGVGLGQPLALVGQLADGNTQREQYHQHKAEH